MCSPDTYTLCWTLYDIYDLIGHLILLITVLLTIHLCLYIISILFQYIFLSYSHKLYALALSLLFLHTHWVAFLTIPNLHIQVHIYSLLVIKYLERITHLTRSQSSLAWSSLLGTLLLSFIPLFP